VRNRDAPLTTIRADRDANGRPMYRCGARIAILTRDGWSLYRGAPSVATGDAFRVLHSEALALEWVAKGDSALTGE